MKTQNETANVEGVALTGQLEAERARSDKERLDWLERKQKGVWISTTRNVRCTTEQKPRAYEEYTFDGWSVNPYDDEVFADPRAAIDAAMAVDSNDLVSGAQEKPG